MLTIGRLREIIEDAEAEGADDGTEVRIAHQPSWPFEYAIDPWAWGVARPEGGGPVLYLAEGSQVGYLPEEAAEAVGWS